MGLLGLPSSSSQPDNAITAIDNSPAFEFTYDFTPPIDPSASVSPDLLLSGLGLDGNSDWLTDGCLLDPSIDLSGGGVMMPEMGTHQTSLEDMSGHLNLLHDDFFSTHQDNQDLLNATTLEQPNPPTAAVNSLAPPSTQTTTISPTSTSNSPAYAPNSSAFSTFAVKLHSSSPSADSSSSSSGGGSKRKAPSSPPEDPAAAKDLKRQRNTLAARKYRQKRLDRISELEQALADMTSDRDDLRLKLARREAEVDALREMLGTKK